MHIPFVRMFKFKFIIIIIMIIIIINVVDLVDKAQSKPL